MSPPPPPPPSENTTSADYSAHCVHYAYGISNIQPLEMAALGFLGFPGP